MITLAKDHLFLKFSLAQDSPNVHTRLTDLLGGKVELMFMLDGKFPLTPNLK